jgi:hypothetical protein
MTRHQAATAQNRAVARELMKRIAAAALRESTAAVERLEAVVATDPAEVSVDEVLAALAAIRRNRRVLDGRIRHLLGAAVLEGAPVRSIARTAHVPVRTMSRWLAGTPAQWRGRVLVSDARCAYGWCAE